MLWIYTVQSNTKEKEKEDGQRNVIVCLVRSRDNIIKATTASSTRTKKKFVMISLSLSYKMKYYAADSTTSVQSPLPSLTDWKNSSIMEILLSQNSDKNTFFLEKVCRWCDDRETCKKERESERERDSTC